MSIKICQFVGNDIFSDCYIISDEDLGKECVIIDPGSEDITEYASYIENNEFTPIYLFITHRHFDHFAGANEIRKKYPSVRLVCNEECNEAIQNPGLNCSRYMYQHHSISLAPAELIYRGKWSMEWNRHHILFVPTPGHTSDSVSIIIEENIFTGDALLKDIPTVTKLPSGNLEKQIGTELFIKSLHGYKAWPGHGDAFVIK